MHNQGVSGVTHTHYRDKEKHCSNPEFLQMTKGWQTSALSGFAADTRPFYTNQRAVAHLVLNRIYTERANIVLQ